MLKRGPKILLCLFVVAILGVLAISLVSSDNGSYYSKPIKLDICYFNVGDVGALVSDVGYDNLKTSFLIPGNTCADILDSSASAYSSDWKSYDSTWVLKQELDGTVPLIGCIPDSNSKIYDICLEDDEAACAAHYINGDLEGCSVLGYVLNETRAQTVADNLVHPTYLYGGISTDYFIYCDEDSDSLAEYIHLNYYDKSFSDCGALLPNTFGATNINRIFFSSESDALSYSQEEGNEITCNCQFNACDEYCEEDTTTTAPDATGDLAYMDDCQIASSYDSIGHTSESGSNTPHSYSDSGQINQGYVNLMGTIVSPVPCSNHYNYKTCMGWQGDAIDLNVDCADPVIEQGCSICTRWNARVSPNIDSRTQNSEWNCAPFDGSDSSFTFSWTPFAGDAGSNNVDRGNPRYNFGYFSTGDTFDVKVECTGSDSKIQEVNENCEICLEQSGGSAAVEENCVLFGNELLEDVYPEPSSERHLGFKINCGVDVGLRYSGPAGSTVPPSNTETYYGPDIPWDSSICPSGPEPGVYPNSSCDTCNGLNDPYVCGGGEIRACIDYYDAGNNDYSSRIVICTSKNGYGLNIVDFGDDKYTVDFTNNLMWEKSQTAPEYFSDASAYCQFSDFSGYGDWRLPTKEELSALFTENAHKVNAQEDRFYWTSNRDSLIQQDDGKRLRFVYSLNTSGNMELFSQKLDEGYTLCVRDEPNPFIGINSCVLGNTFGSQEDPSSDGCLGSFNGATFRNDPLALELDEDCSKINVNCGDENVSENCELFAKFVPSNILSAGLQGNFNYVSTKFNGTNLNLFLEGTDPLLQDIKGSLIDLKVDCQDQKIQDNCKLCRVYNNTDTCVDFGADLSTIFTPEGIQNSPFNLRIDCNISEINSDLLKEKDIFSYGVCYDEDNVNGANDTCVGSNLLEYYNLANGSCASESFICPNGCGGGECYPKDSLNDVYFVYSEQGSFDETINSILGNNIHANVNFRNTRFRLAVDVRFLSAINETAGYETSDFSSAYEINSYAGVNSINKHNYESDKISDEIFGFVEINLTGLEGLNITDLSTYSGNNLYLFRGENWGTYYYPGTYSPIRSSRKGYDITDQSEYAELPSGDIKIVNTATGEITDVISGDPVTISTEPNFTAGVFLQKTSADVYGDLRLALAGDEDTCDGEYYAFYTCPVAETQTCVDVVRTSFSHKRDVSCNAASTPKEKSRYGHGAYVYVDSSGELHFKYETQHPNSRAIFTVGVLACECSAEETRCINPPAGSTGGRYETCDDGCSWTNNDKVIGYCGVEPECEEDDGKDYFTQGYSKIIGLEDETINQDSCNETTGELTEYYCSGTSVTEEIYDCPLGCSSGACLTCEDVDGPDYYTASSSKGYNFFGAVMDQPDVCQGNYVVESVCNEDGYLATYLFKCPTGCINGSCNEIECSVNLTDCSETLYDFVNGTVHYSSENGLTKVCRTDELFDQVFEGRVCGTVEECPLGINETDNTCIKQNCIDADLFDSLGDNYTKSNAEENTGNFLEDFCLEDGVTLSEAVCDGDTAIYEERVCENGCSNGRCLGDFTCVDEGDVGLDYFTKGNTTSCIGEDCVETVPEECVDEDVVWESYCGKNNEVVWQKQFCSAGCVDGACVVPEENQEVGAVCSFGEIGRTVNPGIRVLEDGQLKYCDAFVLELLSVKDMLDDCYNDYECDSNICIEGQCANIRGELEEQKAILEKQTGLLEEIRCYLRGLLGIEDAEVCLGIVEA